jgi:hypothetical protein
MKITVTTDRECCDHREDLQPYHGKHMIPDALKPKFCKHCGQLWYLHRYTDAAGSSDSEYVRFVPLLDRG